MTSATDNRTTELRKLLDERGVEYEKVDGWWTSWETDGATSLPGVVYCEDLGDGLEIRWYTITPEQAIAATLGSERESKLERLARSLYVDYHDEWPDRAEEVYAERMKELGIEVINE